MLHADAPLADARRSARVRIEVILRRRRRAGSRQNPRIQIQLRQQRGIVLQSLCQRRRPACPNAGRVERQHVPADAHGSGAVLVGDVAVSGELSVNQFPSPRAPRCSGASLPRQADSGPDRDTYTRAEVAVAACRAHIPRMRSRRAGFPPKDSACAVRIRRCDSRFRGPGLVVPAQTVFECQLRSDFPVVLDDTAPGRAPPLRLFHRIHRRRIATAPA